jgi:methylmalonyl-CoA/ethylmalonyl-CoA epimerase
MKVHHVGYLVKRIDKAVKEFGKLGYELESAVVRDAIRDIDICFMKKDGYVIELVSPVSEGSVVANLIKRYKNAPYHICYTSTDFNGDVAHLLSSGYVQIEEPKVAPALSNKRVVFLMNPSMGMIELLEG